MSDNKNNNQPVTNNETLEAALVRLIADHRAALAELDRWKGKYKCKARECRKYRRLVVAQNLTDDPIWLTPNAEGQPRREATYPARDCSQSESKKEG